MLRSAVRSVLLFSTAISFIISISLSDRALAQTQTSQYVLVTDVDDTIKVSHIVDFTSKVIRFLSEPVSFAGMSTLYTHMTNEAGARGARPTFVVLSGTPTLFESSVFDFLEIFKFPEPFRVLTRPLLVATKEYKAEAVSDVVGETALNGAAVILVGDDTEYDFAAYKMAARSFSQSAGLQTQVYIRRVTGEATKLVATTPGAVAFDSAVDIAVVEHLNGRLSRAAVESVFTEIENEKDFQRLFVPDEYCPNKKSPRLSAQLQGSTLEPELMTRLIKVEDLLRQRCKSLNAWISGLLE